MTTGIFRMEDGKEVELTQREVDARILDEQRSAIDKQTEIQTETDKLNLRNSMKTKLKSLGFSSEEVIELFRLHDIE